MHHTTPVPNTIFDQHLPHLNKAELKILLVIIRQTIGWIDPITRKRKVRDWICHSFFIKRTKLTHKSVSLAIQSLVEKNIILTLSYHNKVLSTPEERRGKKRIYYTYRPYFEYVQSKTSVVFTSNVCTNPPYTKETHTKENIPATSRIKKLSDIERLQQILKQQKARNK